MAQAQDIIDGMPGPAAILRGAAVVHANAALAGAGIDPASLAALLPGERLETPRPGGGSWVWRAAGLPGGERLVTAEAGAASSHSRERYLAALSHELRTPLNGILGMTGLLAGSRLDADQREYAVALKESGEHLLGLVNDVLDLAKLESGAIDLEPNPVDLERLLQGVSEMLSPRAYEKGLEIAWAAPAGLPQVLADDGRLKQILYNLAGNATKFTATGGVLLSVAASDAASDRIRLRFAVADTGPGVPQADQARIFEEYARLEGPERLEGAGLGLAIVRRLAQAHGGAVGLSDRAGGGSIFWFEAAFDVAGAGAAAANPLAGLTVAVVTANAIVAEAAAQQLAACGARVLIFPTVAAAAAAADPAVMLIDYALKGTSRSLRPPDGRPCIVLLAPEERARIARCRALGFAGYLIKPLRRASVAQRVLAVAGRGLGAAAGETGEDERITASAGFGLRVLLAEDNPINALLARSLLEREGCTVDRAANGADAVAATAAAAYDLILMDVRMPVMDGLDATAALRAAGVSAPVVALTADTFEDDRKACRAVGMNDFLTKPLDPAALRAVLTRWAGFTRPRPEAKLAS